MIGKRGQGLSTNAIILIVLGVIILAVLVVGFTIGWGQIAPFISQTNVDTIQTSCETACVLESNYGFCAEERELRWDGKTLEGTCNDFSMNNTLIANGITISSCPGITCEGVVEKSSEEESE